MQQHSTRPATPIAAQAAAMVWAVAGVLTMAAFVGWAAGAVRDMTRSEAAGAFAAVLTPILLVVAVAVAVACAALARGIWRNSAAAHVISLIGLLVLAGAGFATAGAHTIPLEEKAFLLACLAAAGGVVAAGGILGLASCKQSP